MKRHLTVWAVILLVTVGLIETAHARRLKVYRLPKQIAPGQLGIIVFENPTPDQPKSQSLCTAPKLIGWTKSEVPILRIEQNGKQVWMSLDSYRSIGDSCFATFMAPVSLVPGPATVFIVNGSDPSIPYPLHVEAKLAMEVSGIDGSSISALGTIRIVGDGFVPEIYTEKKKVSDELEANIGLSKLLKAQQWSALNHRIMKDWDKLPEGDYLMVEQGGTSWRAFAEECGIEAKGMTLDFIAPPDLTAGAAKLTLVVILNGAEAARSTPLMVTVQ
jgi:hypothetical protein